MTDNAHQGQYFLSHDCNNNRVPDGSTDTQWCITLRN